MYAYMNVYYVCMQICMCVCMHVCMYAYKYVRIYMYAYTCIKYKKGYSQGSIVTDATMITVIIMISAITVKYEHFAE